MVGWLKVLGLEDKGKWLVGWLKVMLT